MTLSWHRRVVTENGAEWTDYYLGDDVRVYSQRNINDVGVGMRDIYEVHVRDGNGRWIWQADRLTLATAKKYAEGCTS